MLTNASGLDFPYFVARRLNAYKPRFRQLITRFLKEKNLEQFTLSDIEECVSMAYEVLIQDTEDTATYPNPNSDLMHRALKEYRAGEWRPAEDILNDIQGAGSSKH